MSTKSTLLIIIGAILISIALANASSIPLEANRDLHLRAHKQKDLRLRTVEREDMYIQAHVQRRLLQNFYLGASGLICLLSGLLVLPNKNTRLDTAKAKKTPATMG